MLTVLRDNFFMELRIAFLKPPGESVERFLGGSRKPFVASMQLLDKGVLGNLWKLKNTLQGELSKLIN
jgi:hypothetical protein